MTRFAGDGGLKLQDFSLTGGPRSNAASAADNVSLGTNYSALEKRKPRYDQMAADWITDRGEEQMAATNAERDVIMSGMQAQADVYTAKEQAKAEEKAAKANASASRTSSTIGGIATVASAALGLFSDEETKHTVEAIDDALSTLRQLKPVTFYYKEGYSPYPDRKHHGFIAQEFQKVLPDATYVDQGTDKLCIDTADVIGLLVRANQQLEARIARLEAKNALAGVK